jgi:hypothetical protein
LCEIVCDAADSILGLKAKIEVEAGLDSETLSLYLPSVETPLGEHKTVEICGFPSELYAAVTQKVNIATDVAHVEASKLTSKQLAKACSSPEGQAGDIISLKNCDQLRDMGCLMMCEQMHTLDISGCDSIDAATMASVITEHK